MKRHGSRSGALRSRVPYRRAEHQVERTMSEAGIDQDPSAEAIEGLRIRLANDAGAVMVFLGAGLSFGVGRSARNSLSAPDRRSS
jgi:hypothetical protein